MRVGILGALFLLTASSGCSEQLYGVGSLYIWNGTDQRADVTLEGRNEAQLKLRLNRGELLEKAVAGPGSAVINLGGKPSPTLEFEVVKDRLTVLNLGGKGCFARCDVAGMYKRGRDRVRVLEMYRGDPVIPLKNAIAVMPDQRLPAQAPRITNETVYQRFAVVPCRMVRDNDEDKVAEFVRKLR